MSLFSIDSTARASSSISGTAGYPASAVRAIEKRAGAEYRRLVDARAGKLDGEYAALSRSGKLPGNTRPLEGDLRAVVTKMKKQALRNAARNLQKELAGDASRPAAQVRETCSAILAFLDGKAKLSPITPDAVHAPLRGSRRDDLPGYRPN